MAQEQQNVVDFKKLRPCNQAIAFARVSKREQKEGASHDAQIEATIDNNLIFNYITTLNCD